MQKVTLTGPLLLIAQATPLAMRLSTGEILVQANTLIWQLDVASYDEKLKLLDYVLIPCLNSSLFSLKYETNKCLLVNMTIQVKGCSWPRPCPSKWMAKI